MTGRLPEGESLPDGAEIDCNACGDVLYFTPDVYPLVFHCKQGHFFMLRDLLDRLLSGDRHPPTSALHQWRSNSRILRQMAARALELGHSFTAADFQEAANRIDQWVATLISLLPSGRSGSASTGS